MSTNLPASPILSAFIAEAEDLRIRLLAHVREHAATGRPFQGLTAIGNKAVSRVDEFCAHFGEGDRPAALSGLSVDELIALLIGFGPLEAPETDEPEADEPEEDKTTLQRFQEAICDSEVGRKHLLTPADVQVQEVGSEYRVDVGNFQGYTSSLLGDQEDLLAHLEDHRDEE